MHCFIAAYGTQAANAKHLGSDEDAQTRKRMTDKMKRADEQMTRLAEEEANERASSGN